MLMAIRLCPICRLNKLTRREVKTCGAAECVEMWRSLTAEQRGHAIEAAADAAYPMPMARPTDQSLLSPEEVLARLNQKATKDADDEFFSKHPEFLPKKEDKD